MIITPPNFKKEYNIESFFADMEVFLKQNMNPFIAKMNSDKPDLILKTIDDAAYFFQTMNEETANYDPFLFYGEKPESSASSTGSSTAKIYLVDIAIIMAIGNEDSYVAGNKLLRYRSILESLFELGNDKIGRAQHIEVSSMSPFPMALTNSSAPYAGIGVTIELSLS